MSHSPSDMAGNLEVVPDARPLKVLSSMMSQESKSDFCTCGKMGPCSSSSPSCRCQSELSLSPQCSELFAAPEQAKPLQAPTTLNELVAAIHAELGSSGLTDDHVDVNRVIALMEMYQSRSQDWDKYAYFDSARYTRNLVDDGNGKFNLMLLAWPASTASAIHDHSNAHCIMKMLSGSLEETRFKWPDGSSCGNGASCQRSDDLAPMNACDEAQLENARMHTEGTCMKIVGKSLLSVNQVAYIHDKIGLHRVANPSPEVPAVSLHLYCPPFDYCRTYVESTGEARASGRCVFYSKKGEKCVYIKNGCV